MTVKIIKGITWNHSRAFPPLIAAAQRYEELNPGVRIHWDKRTLDEFGHKPIDELIHAYDLIVIDHPWAEFCFNRKLVLDLKRLLHANQYADLEENCMGNSFGSYLWEDKLLAVPIDMATPVPSWRPDLLEKNDVQPPGNWDELVALADRKLAVMPAFGADLFLNWMMLLFALDANPFERTETIAIREKAIEAASLLKRLAEPMPKEIFDWNPILIGELLTRQDDFAYCPFAYSYGNYSRPSFTEKPLQYGNLIELNGRQLKSILGGTGIAIASGCREPQLALDFSLFCAGADVQRNIYTYAGGQPVRKEAWDDVGMIDFTGGFFRNSYQSHTDALVRPRYDGYVPLQEKAGLSLQKFLKGELTADRMWAEIESLYRASRRGWK